MKLVRVNWKRPVPLWMLLIAIVATVSVTTGAILLPIILSPKPDFAMSLNMHPMYLSAEGSNQTLITIQPIGSFTGVVTFATRSPVGLTTGTLDPHTGGTRDQIWLGGGGNLSVSVVPKIVGNFTVTVTASSGAIIHSASFPVIVENLTLIPNPSFLTIARGSTGTTEIDLSSVNGLSDILTFGSTVFLSYPAVQLVAGYSNSSLTPNSISISPHRTGKIVLGVTVGQAEQTLDGHLKVLVAAHTVREPWTFLLLFWVNVV